MTKRTLQILMVAAALWVTTPSTAQASSVTLQMSFSAGFDQGALVGFGIGPYRYDFALIFEEVVSPFTIDVTANDTPNLSNLPPGYTCVPINGGSLPGSNCIMFTATPSDPLAWRGGYDLTITWQADTNTTFPNTPVDPNLLGRIRILHFDSSGVTDITTPNSYCTTCVVDPAIGGKDDNFSDFMVVSAPAAVPEPATMVLLGSGLVVLAVRLRRNRRQTKS